MTTTDVADLLLRIGALALASGGAAQLVKWPLQLALVRLGRYPERGRWRAMWLGGLRFGAVATGGTLGHTLDLWPAWLQPDWGPLLGLIAGVSSSAVYDAWHRIIGGAPGVVLDAAAARLGGGKGHAGDGALSESGSVEAVEATTKEPA